MQPIIRITKFINKSIIMELSVKERNKFAKSVGILVYDIVQLNTVELPIISIIIPVVFAADINIPGKSSILMLLYKNDSTNAYTTETQLASVGVNTPEIIPPIIINIKNIDGIASTKAINLALNPFITDGL